MFECISLIIDYNPEYYPKCLSVKPELSLMRGSENFHHIVHEGKSSKLTYDLFKQLSSREIVISLNHSNLLFVVCNTELISGAIIQNVIPMGTSRQNCLIVWSSNALLTQCRWNIILGSNVVRNDPDPRPLKDRIILSVWNHNS